MVQGSLDTTVRDIFESHTVEQLRTYVASTKKEVRSKQDELKTLVGDRYQDLILSSDMILDMGSVCKDLMSTFGKPTSIPAAAEGEFEARKLKKRKKRVEQCQVYLRQATEGPQQIWQWMDAGMYLEATMAYLNTQTSLTNAVKVLNHTLECSRREGEEEEEATRVMRQKAVKLTNQLQVLPQTILSRASLSLSNLSAPTGQPSPCPTLLASYAEVFSSVLLLKGLTFTGALKHFLQLRRDKIRELAEKASTLPSAEGDVVSDGRSLALEMLASMQSVLLFVHAVFVVQSVPVNPSLFASAKLYEQSYEGVEGNARRSLFEAFSITTNLTPTCPLVKLVNDKLSQSLPAGRDVQMMCTDWLSEVFPIILAGIKDVLKAMERAKDIMELEDSLLELVSTFSKPLSGGQSQGFAKSKDWDKGLADLVDDRTRHLVRDMFKDLKVKSVQGLKEALVEIQAEPEEGSPTTEKVTWFAAVISDEDVAARYRLSPDQPPLKDASSHQLVAKEGVPWTGTAKNAIPSLPPILLDPSIPSKAKDSCINFYHQLSQVLNDMGYLVLRVRHAPHTDVAQSQKVEKAIYEELISTLKAVCAELSEVKASVTLPYLSQGISSVISALASPFMAQVSTNQLSAMSASSPSLKNRVAANPAKAPFAWKKEALNDIHEKLHAIYMAGHMEWIESAAQTMHGELHQHLAHSYLGPDSVVFKKLHASSWCQRKGDDGVLHIPCMANSYVLNAMYNTCQAIKVKNISLLRASVVEELHRVASRHIFSTYLEFLQDPGTALGYYAADGTALDAGSILCEEGWLQILFDMRFLGALMLPKPHDQILSGPKGTKEETLYAEVYKLVEDAIDPINWNAYQSHIEATLQQFLQSVSILLSCHAVEGKSWSRKDKSDKDASKEKDDRVNLLALAPECDRFPLLPLLPLHPQTNQASIRAQSASSRALADTAANFQSPYLAAVAFPAGGNTAKSGTGSTSISQWTGGAAKKLWGMFDK